MEQTMAWCLIISLLCTRMLLPMQGARTCIVWLLYLVAVMEVSLAYRMRQKFALMNSWSGQTTWLGSMTGQCSVMTWRTAHIQNLLLQLQTKPSGPALHRVSVDRLLLLLPMANSTWVHGTEIFIVLTQQTAHKYGITQPKSGWLEILLLLMEKYTVALGTLTFIVMMPKMALYYGTIQPTA